MQEQRDSESKVVYDALEDLDCPLCHALFMDPITTPCGHNFCKKCIIRALDYSDKCPICRTVIFINPTHPVNTLIRNMAQKLCPAEYSERQKEIEQDLSQLQFNLPLFILNDVLFPEMPLPLHIFEVRYRYLLRQTIESGTRSFGVIQPQSDVGTIAVIDKYFKFPDGRSVIHTKGTKRFKVLDRHVSSHGYQVARVEEYDDVPTEEGEQGKDVETLLIEVRDTLQMKLWGQERRAIEERFGVAPLTDPEKLSFWMAAVLPLTNQQKQQLLEMQSTVLRLHVCKNYAVQKKIVAPSTHKRRKLYCAIFLIFLILYICLDI
eukprot:TRINITY_DN10882_c0_g1_i2.p1 TRINITY_DN10882_c0_g1~~TRINITY_DN10882_c0_g1_i2.p1  ORF type:complete len:320 (-),score=38.51 TRINITY_DN10882_c0_g1_i2:210-1169(-)